jgi:hypothetical protein
MTYDFFEKERLIVKRLFLIVILCSLWNTFPDFAHAESYPVKGYIDGVQKIGDSYFIRGWACQVGKSYSINVHVYLRGAAGQGRILKVATANQSSEIQVADQCGTTYRYNRFKIELSVTELYQHRGEKIFIHGISQTSTYNRLLTRSGVYQMPTFQYGQTDLPGFNLPHSLQGIFEPEILISESRYEKLGDELRLSMQHFNLFWAHLEEEGKFSQSDPQKLHCGTGYFMFPANSTEKVRLGIHKYRCISEQVATAWDRRFQKSDEWNIDSAAVLWTTPVQYRNPGCNGFYFPEVSQTITGGCYPAKMYYNDFEDWMTFVTTRWGEYIDHYVIWNEVASLNWSDPSSSSRTMSTIRTNLTKNFAREADYIMQYYVELFNIAANMVEQHDAGNNIIYVSLDDFSFSSGRVIDHNSHVYIGNKTVLDAMWEKIGFNHDWGIAYHPYQMSTYDEGIIQHIASYQKSQIMAHGVGSWLTKSQSRFFFSEQSAVTTNINDKAAFICRSHDFSIAKPYIISQTHHYFQVQSYNTKLSDTQLDKYAMLPKAVGKDLENNRFSYPTYQAYYSTAPHNWGENNNHYCCKQHGMGCRRSGATAQGDISGRNTVLISGWAYDPDLSWESVRVQFRYNGQIIGSTLADRASLDVNDQFDIGGNHGFLWYIPSEYQNVSSSIEVWVVEASSDYLRRLY